MAAKGSATRSRAVRGNEPDESVGIGIAAKKR